MEHSEPTDDLRAAQAENRHHTDAIRAIRAKLESVQADGRENVQKATAELSAEIIQLKETAAELRAQLERIDADYQQQIHDINRDAGNEMKQLQETISALRTQLEASNVG